MVAAGVGVAMLPQSLVTGHARVVVRALHLPAPTRRVGLCYAAQALEMIDHLVVGGRSGFFPIRRGIRSGLRSLTVFVLDGNLVRASSVVHGDSVGSALGSAPSESGGPSAEGASSAGFFISSR